MTAIVTTFGLFVGFFVLQTSVFSTAFLWLSRATDVSALSGQTLDLPLLLLIFLGLHRDRSGTVLWSVTAGILAGSFGLAWKGAGSMGFLAAGLSCMIARRGILLEGAGAVALLAGVIAAVAGVVRLWFGHLMNGVSEPITGQFTGLVLNVAIHAFAAPILFPLFRWLSRFSGGTPERNTRSLVMDF